MKEVVQKLETVAKEATDYSGDFVRYTVFCKSSGAWSSGIFWSDVEQSPGFLHLIFGMSGGVSVLQEVKGLHCLSSDNSICDRRGSGLMNLHGVRDGNTPYRCKFHQSTDSV